MCMNCICGCHHSTCISQFTWSVPSWKLCTWTSPVSMLYDDHVVSTPHIWLVPRKEYRWGGLQWHFVYIDFHKHQFINVCNVSVLYTYITVCLQPDLILEIISLWCGSLWQLLKWIRGVIYFTVFVICVFFLLFFFFYECQYALLLIFFVIICFREWKQWGNCWN